MSRAFAPTFDVALKIELERAYLACCGPLMARAVVHFQLGPISWSSSPAALSANPSWGEAHVVTVPAAHAAAPITLRVEDALTGRFLGAGTLRAVKATGRSAFQVMLEPRFVEGTKEPLAEDNETLQTHAADDFGFVRGTVEASLVPLLPPGAGADHEPSALPSGVSFPIGCGLRVTWLAVEASGRFSVHADFGGHGNFPVSSTAPLFVSVGSAADCVVTLHARHVDGTDNAPEEADARFRLPLHLMGVGVDMALPVVGADGVSVLGLLLVNVALTNRPEVPTAPPAADFGRAPPQTPPSLFHAVTWESDAHVARSTERRWRRSVLQEAAPQPDHVRHLHDVVTRSAELSPSLLPLVRAFYNLPGDGQPVSCDLRPLLCGLAFACTSLDCREAALFVFESLCGSRGATRDDLAWLLEHCLLPKSLDLPVAEVQRRASDLWMAYAPLAGGKDALPLRAFDFGIARNPATWYALGSALEAVPLAAPGASGAGSAANQTTPGGSEDANWRHFVVRAAVGKLAFAVTAHKDDTFKRVAKQIEGSIGINALKQQMLHDQTVVDQDLRVAALISPSTQPTQQIIVAEVKDTVTVTCVYRARNMKWDVTMKQAEKVLRLRALVQQKTNVPLSRLHLSFGGGELFDRHPLTHYGVFDGSVIEVKSA